MDIQEALETVKENTVDKAKDVVENIAESGELAPKKGAGVIDRIIDNDDGDEFSPVA